MTQARQHKSSVSLCQTTTRLRQSSTELLQTAHPRTARNTTGHNRPNGPPGTSLLANNAPRRPASVCRHTAATRSTRTLAPTSSYVRKRRRLLGSAPAIVQLATPLRAPDGKSRTKATSAPLARQFKRARGASSLVTVRKWPSTQLRLVSRGHQAGAGTSHPGVVQQLREHQHPSSQAPRPRGAATPQSASRAPRARPRGLGC